MRRNILSVISIVLAAIMTGCADDGMIPPHGWDDDSPLQFAVNAFTVSGGDGCRGAEPSDYPEPESAQEKAIHDFWLFQFKSDGTQLAAPVYYTIGTDGATLNELTRKAYDNLTRNTLMTIYVVANTGDPDWVTASGFATLDEVKAQKLAQPSPIRLKEEEGGINSAFFIPMSGELSNVTVMDKSIVVVSLTRMYAKVKIKTSFTDTDMTLYYVDIAGIPWYCKVTSMTNGVDAGNGEPAAVPFPENTMMISRAFKSSDAVTEDDGSKWLVLYIPENIRGEIDNADKATGQNIPENALTVKIKAKRDGADFYFTVYPGENIRNNFNIRRNCVYRVSVAVNKSLDQHNPSSNCFVVNTDGLLAFEPYNRVEKGGGYSISDYLDPTVSEKQITRVAIIWQTKDCIGDNTNGDLVYLGPETENPVNRKIYVKTGKEGNALIGAYNSNNEIIWSWHIWVTDNEPDNIANAVIYATYRWDSGGIYNNEPRIPGYGVMPCNIGALAFRSADDMSDYSLSKGTKFPDSQIRTFGMLYQWGRKDPFPPMIYSTGTEDDNGDLEYTNQYTGDHYANNNRTIVNKISDYNTTWNNLASRYLFYSVVGQAQNSPVKYGIAHPTVYMSGTGSTIGGAGTNGFNRYNGDWCGSKGDDALWGGEKGSGGLAIDNGAAHLFDNYGGKSIFDPCPTGWRVPPGDLWLGFTLTGLNPDDYENEVNYSREETGKRPGLCMYLQGWRTGATAYFPLQGTRQYNGRCKNTGLCGNYHNATCDVGSRVNLLHLHRNMAIVSESFKSLKLFKLFEYDHPEYYSKSTAGPIRCVRDSR